MSTHKVSLEEVLNARDKRVELINQAIDKYPKHSVLSFKLNIPGPIKTNQKYRDVFKHGLKLLSNLELVVDLSDNLTGPEAILISTLSKEELKKAMINIEDNHPLGRLFDLDVIGISRSSLDYPSRKCLVCDEVAHACSRSKTHTLDTILNEIDEIINRAKILENTNLTDLISFETIDSTNTYAKTLASNSNIDNTLIIAKHQSKGKGRGYNKFYSPKDAGLYMSLIKRINLSQKDSQLITIAAALAISRTFDDLKLNSQIKWINDIYLDNKKVSGILVEGSLNETYTKYDFLVIGIGINLYTSHVDESLKHIYTALDQHLEDIDETTIIIKLINYFEVYLEMIEVSKIELITQYTHKCLNINKRIQVKGKNEIYTALSINKYGNLIVEDDMHNSIVLKSGEVSIINEDETVD